MPQDTRLYLTNKQKYTLNADHEIENIDIKGHAWEDPDVSPHFDGTTDSVGMRFINVKKGTALKNLSINILKFESEGEKIDLRSLTMTTDANATGTLKITYGDYNASLSAGQSLTNKYTGDEPVTGKVIISGNGYYGKLTITYKTYIDDLLSVESATCTIYWLPYPKLRLLLVDSVLTPETESTDNSATYENSDPDSSLDKNNNDASYNSQLSFSNSYDSTTNKDFYSSEKEAIVTYIDSLLVMTIENSKIAVDSVTRDDKTISTTDFSYVYKGSSFQVEWGDLRTYPFKINTLEEGTYVVGTLATASSELNNNDQILTLTLTYKINKYQNIYTSDTCEGYVRTVDVDGIPLTMSLILTSGTRLDLSDDSFFNSTTTVIVENATDDTITIKVNNADGSNDGSIYFTPEDDNTKTLSAGKKMVFIRILFEPSVFDASAEI